MKEIKYNNEVYAIHDFISKKMPIGTKWYGKESDSIQASIATYNKDKKFRKHVHNECPRIIKRTQECFVVLQGILKANIYTEDGKTLIERVDVKGGNILLCLKGAHSFEVLEDNTLFYEIKCGEYVGVENDKTFLE